jgi:Na+/pantothenate symporter
MVSVWVVVAIGILAFCGIIYQAVATARDNRRINHQVSW